MTQKELRELDAEIHQKVMRVYGYDGPFVMVQGEPVWLNEAGTPVTCPCYSEDIAAAWLVVEKLDLFGTKELVLSRRTDGKWTIDRYVPVEFEPGNWKNIAIGETAPHVICLAALEIEKQS